jgi:hypothetical protein
MVPYLLLGAVGAVLAVLVLLLGKSPLGRRRVPPGALIALGGVVLSVGLAYVVTGGFDFSPPRPGGQPPGMPGAGPLPPGDYPEGPLAVGAPAPPLDVAGWLNGPPPAPWPDGPRATVLDVWAFW